MEDARAARELIHPVPQDDGARSRDRAADELGALSKVVIRDNRGRLMKSVVRAHDSGALQLAEFLGERIKAARQLLQTFRVGVDGVEREADPSDHLGYDAEPKLGLQGAPPDVSRTALDTEVALAAVDLVYLGSRKAHFDDMVTPSVHGRHRKTNGSGNEVACANDPPLIILCMGLAKVGVPDPVSMVASIAA